MLDPLTQAAVLLGAGVLTGLVGYATGMASLVSFPVLLAVGLPPVTANVTNTVALTGLTVGGLTSARAELAGQRHRLLRFGVAGLVGGLAGAGLLLALPPGVFERVVPGLVALGGLALLLRPWLLRLHGGRLDERHPLVLALVTLVAVYGGYFGAAAGVLLLATLGAVLADRVARLSALRAAVLGAANTVAAVVFVATGAVHWPSALPLGLGALVGGWLGPPTLRRLPETPLRVAVGLAGLAVAAWLALDPAR